MGISLTKLSVLCTELRIEVIALYPNATRIMQPADVAVFRPVKMAWRKAVRDWQVNHPGEVLNKVSFGPLLENVVSKSIKPETLVNGFKACGLFPLDDNAIDYSKCLGSENDGNAKQENNNEKQLDYETFRKIVGEERLQQFEKIDELLPNDSEDFLILYRLWKHFRCSDRINIIQNCVVQKATESPLTKTHDAKQSFSIVNIPPSVNMLNNMLEDHDNLLQPVQNDLLPNILLQQAAEASINETNNAQKSFYDLSVPPPVKM